MDHKTSTCRLSKKMCYHLIHVGVNFLCVSWKVICISSTVQHFFGGQNFASWQPKKEVVMTNTKFFLGEKHGPKLPDFEGTCFEIIKF